MNTPRPNPDALLEQLQDDAKAAARGKLRVYFGASAGVGKTYAMLSAAQRATANGQEVLVGVIETHGRRETMEMLAGLPQLPLRKVPYREQVLLALDLDAALAAKPAVLLVDELAHSNAPGSRHPKRWQDVQELLAAGIDVWTTVNVQHLESLNGTVGAITGIRVNETVPDTVLDEAEELILIDVTADELLARLKAGKVYVPQQAERATQNFFKKGNLYALREIALRRTAEHAGDDVRSYRARHLQAAASSSPTWNTSGDLLVCVGPGVGAEHAVRSAARLAGQLSVRWHAVYVETPALQRTPRAARDRTLAVLKLAQDLGGISAVLTGEDIALALLAQAQLLNCACLVLGRPKQNQWWRSLWPTLTRRLATLAPSLDVIEIGASERVRKLGVTATQVDSESRGPWLHEWTHYTWAVAACVCTTLLTLPLVNTLELTNIVMLYLLCVVAVAWRLGRGASMLATLISVMSFDFFFVPPRFSFAVSDVQYVLTFIVMSAVGLLIGQLTAHLRFSAQVATNRERRAQSLFELTRELSAALQTVQVIEMGELAVQRTFGGKVKIFLPDANDRMQVSNIVSDGSDGLDPALVDWSFHNAQSAGLATDTLPSSSWQYVPLQAPMRIRGVLALQPTHPRWLLIPEQVQQLMTLARQIAIALERVHYVEVAQSAVVQMESERLRNTLLAAMSHDVRTPLTALVGQAEALAHVATLSPEHHASAVAISIEARELSALVTNLLEMAKLESGQIELRQDWQSVEEVVGSAIRSARHALGTIAVRTAIPADLPLVEFDAGLIERVLVNLLENAAKYGVQNLTRMDAIIVSASTSDTSLILKVRDFGPGLPRPIRGQEIDLFAKFTRGEFESAKRGVGLGLAICKSIVVAHHGKITATTQTNDGGAEFTVTLPRTPAPALPAPDGLA